MYQALYREYRPKTFDQVIGQEHITRTLKNQIKNENIGHAYLFAGTRGTGKTSTAKIFSRAVNCLNKVDGNPCNECEICKGILDESIMDVIEMDAASNRGIEDIRELRDKVVYPPSRSKYKVYIIDEVHMLTEPAFNALLKTLEEPPKHLIFILATTEMQKLPQTILSRCQRFDFKRITSKDMTNNMKAICEKLNVSVDEKALNIISRNSDGAMRDAISLLDQCISYKDGELSYEDVLNILGISGRDLLFKMVENIRQKELESLLFEIDSIIQDGKDINQLIKDLIFHFRNLLIAKTSKNPIGIMDMDEETINMYVEQSKEISLDFILKSLDILNKSEDQAKWTTQPRIILEMTAIKLINLEEQISLEERIEKLEAIISSEDIPAAKSTTNRVKPEQAKVKPQTKEEIKLDKKTQATKIVDDGKELAFETIKEQWNQVLDKVKKEKIQVHALLKDGKLNSFENNNLKIVYSDGFAFHKDAVNKPDNKELVENIVASHFNKNININFVMGNEIISEKPKKKEVENKKIIKEVIDFFGKDIVEIKK